MHILGGILLLVAVFGVFFFLYQSHIFQPLAPGFLPPGNSLIPHPTSTSNNSQFYHEVKIQFVSLGAGLDEPMVLSLVGMNQSRHPGITLTGWTLRTDKGKYAIPKVQNVYSPSVQGVPPEDIYLRAHGTVNFYSGKNPQGKVQYLRSGLTEWQLWLGQDFLAVPHGKVTLTDEVGKIVDEYEY